MFEDIAQEDTTSKILARIDRIDYISVFRSPFPMTNPNVPVRVFFAGGTRAEWMMTPEQIESLESQLKKCKSA